MGVRGDCIVPSGCAPALHTALGEWSARSASKPGAATNWSEAKLDEIDGQKLKILPTTCSPKYSTSNAVGAI